MKIATFVAVMLFVTTMITPPLTSAQDTVKDATAIASVAVSLATLIDKNCDDNRPEGGYTVCKGGECVSGKCITLRKRCEKGC